MENQRFVPLGYVQITDLSAAVAMKNVAGGIPAGANMMLLLAEAQNVRWTDDGVTAPTATVGMILPTGAAVPFQYSGNLAAFTAIQAAGGGKLNVSFYRVAG